MAKVAPFQLGLSREPRNTPPRLDWSGVDGTQRQVAPVAPNRSHGTTARGGFFVLPMRNPGPAATGNVRGSAGKGKAWASRDPGDPETSSQVALYDRAPV